MRVDAPIECNAHVSIHARTTTANRAAPFRPPRAVAREFLPPTRGSAPPNRTPCGGDRLVSSAVAGRRNPDPAPLQCGRAADPHVDLARGERAQSVHGAAGR